MSSILSQLGLEEEGLQWQDLASCKDAKPSWFFEDYEQDTFFAKSVDLLCKSCLVQKSCLDYGIKNKETGVWGGWYLDRGKIDPKFNAHKEKND